MAFTAEGINKVKERTRWENRRYPGVTESLRALWAHFVNIGNPDAQFVAYSGLETADAVICAGACTLRALFIKKPSTSTVASWLKGSNHATVAAANGDIVVIQPAAMTVFETCPIFADGIPLTTGLTLGAHTTVNGNTKSLVADAPTGFAIITA